MYLTRYWIKKIREKCYTELYIKTLTLSYIALVRSEFFEKLSTSLHATYLFKIKMFSSAYSVLYQSIIRNNMLKYSRFLRKRDKLCQSERSLI